MKKLLIALCLTVIAAPVFAEHIYDYQNTRPLNDAEVIKTNGTNEYVKLESTGISAHDNDTTFIRAVGRTARQMAVASVSDPYVITIDGNTYVLVKDRDDDEWSAGDILGIDDPKENRFASLIALNSDMNHAKLTPEELKKARIRFVRLDKNGVLLVEERNKDFDLNKIDYIDIINLKRTANSENTGIFGHFTVFLKTNTAKKRAVVGYVTFETRKTINVLFK